MEFIPEESFFDTQAMFVCDQTNFAILDVNEAAVKVLGFSRSYYLGKSINDLGSLNSKNLVKPSSGDTKTAKEEPTWTFITKDSRQLYFQLSYYLIHYKGKPAKLVIAHNVSDYIEGAQQKGELLSRHFSLNNFPMAEIEWDTSLRVLSWSNKAEDMFGYTAAEAKTEKGVLKKFIHPDDVDFVRTSIRETIANGEKEISHINRNITKNGDVIYCEWHNFVLYADEGEVSAIYSLTHDVTDRELALRDANRSTKSYQDLFNSISDAIYLLDKQGVIVEANKGLEETFGYARSEVVGKHNRVLAVPEKYDEDRIYQIHKQAKAGQNGKYEGWGKRKDGHEFPTEFFVHPGFYFGKEVLIVTERDVTEQRESEEALKKREGLFAKLFNSLPIGIALLNEHRQVEMVNDGFEHLFGYPEEELKGKELDKVIVPDSEHETAKELSDTDRVKQVVEKRVRKDGKMLDVIIYAIPVVVGKEVVGIYGIYVDITARRKAEDQLRKSLHEKEVLLAEIHHRVKNNLAVITGLLELQAFSVQNEDAQSVLKDSQMRVHSIALVHEKFYQNDDLSQVSVDKYFRELTDMIHKNMRKQDTEVQINLNLDAVSLPITKAIPCGLLLNEILTNSYKHAFKGRKKGTIDVSLSNGQGNKLFFTLKDDGIGLPDQPENGVHSSLGMTLIKTLAKQLNAECKRYADNGTVFEFEFEKKEQG